MATAKAEPQVGLIFRIAFLIVVLLVATRGLLLAYFDHMVRAEDHQKQVAPAALIDLRADEKQRLMGGPMPIAQAMQQMAGQGRMGNPAMAPTNSRDVAPLAGWTMMPSVVPPAMTATPSVVDAGAEPAAAVDAGTKPGRGADAGAKKAPGKRQP